MTLRLSLIADLIEADAGASTTANPTEAGYWKRIALAAESLAGAGTSANTGKYGYMRRTADALETLAGAATVANRSEDGYVRRMVAACEALGTTPNVGAWLYQFQLAIDEYSAISPTISAIDATGWQSTMPVPVDLALDPVFVSRQGFTAAGAATTHAETLYTTKRVRQPYPNHASLTTDTVAMSDVVYSTDTISGVTNNSTETSPKAVANWAMIDRRVVGDSVDLEVVAFHRNGVACVEFRATDGTTTVTSVVSTVTISNKTGDQFPVLVYAATLDISTLADNANITVNAKVFPRIGAAASVQDSADNASLFDFCPRTFTRKTAADYIVYVASGGNDTTGAVSQTDATAAASPCLTLHGAINRARTVLGTGAGALDGLRVRLTAGTWSFTASPTANTTNAEIVIEPATGQSKATVAFNFGAGAFHANSTYVRFRDLAIARLGVYPIHNKGSGGCVIEDFTWDNNADTNATVAGTGGCLLSFINGTLSEIAGSNVNAGVTQIIRMIRGVTATANGTSVNIGLEQRCLIGSSFKGFLGNNGAARAINNCVIAFNRYQGGSLGTGMVDFDAPTVLTNIAIVQNIFEFTSTASAAALALSHDNKVGSTRHLILWHNTLAGVDGYGRGNILYDETTGTARTHKVHSFVGNIHDQINTKHDVFKLDGTRVGGWSYLYGVGCRGEFSRYRDAGTGSFKQDYPGLGASIGTSNTSPGNDPLFTSPAHTTAGPVAGAGGGTYTLQAGSPADNLVTDSPVPFDLAGNARSGTVAAGAYA